MTPERQCWWDSLPGYEKQIRRLIKTLKGDSSCCKQEIADELAAIKNDCSIGKNRLNAAKDNLRGDKLAIKVLRKEIAMDVIALHNSAYEYYTCPYCGQNVKEGDVTRDEDNYCASCGQKLRWE